jgi:chromosome segregation ATPase
MKQHAEKEREFSEWEQRLNDKQQQIEGNIINCDDMLRQADAKREHAEDNAKRDVETQQSSMRDILKLRAQLDEIRAKCVRRSNQIQASAKYFEFLCRSTQTILARNSSKTEDVYELVEEILDRHRTLSRANQQLQIQFKTTARSHDDLINVHNKYVDDSQENILALNTCLGGMKRSLESSVRSTSASMTTMTHFVKKSTLKHASVSLVKMAAENIFVKCTSYSHVARCATGREHVSETSVRLSIIRHFLCDMRQIIFETACDRQ